MSKHSTQVTLSGFKGPLNQLMENLTGPDHVRWSDLFKKFLRKEEVWQMNRFKVAGILKSNGFIDKHDKDYKVFFKALSASGCAVTERARQAIIDNYLPQYRGFEEKIIILSPRELGFNEPTSYFGFGVCKRAQEYGFDLCFIPTALELAMQAKTFFDLEESKMVYIATDVVRDSAENRSVFGIQIANGKVEFCTLSAELDSKINPDDTFVFTRT